MMAAFTKFSIAALVVSSLCAAQDAESVSYWHDVRPILQAHCYGCHQPAKAKGDIALTTHALLTSGGDEAIVIGGDAAGSMLIEVVTPDSGEPPSMPANGDPLGEAAVTVLRRWVEQGAHDDTPAGTHELAAPDKPPTYERAPVVTALDWSPDGAWLAVGGHHEVLLHDIKARETADIRIEARLVGLSNRIEDIAFSPDGKHLAVAGGSPGRFGEVQIWDVASRELHVSHVVTNDCVFGVSWPPDGARVAFGCADTTARVIDAENGKQVFFQSAHDDWVLDTVFSTDASHLVTVGRDRSMKLHLIEAEQFIDNITSITPGALRGGILAVDRHPTKDELLTAGADGEPKLFRMYREKKRKIGDDYNRLKTFEKLPGRVFAASFDPTGERVLFASSDSGRGALRMATVADAKSKWTIELDSALYAAAISPNGKRVAAAGFAGEIFVFDAENGERLTQLCPVPLETRDTPKEIATASFLQEVMPILSRRGCNAGTCHGSKDGQNGFKLSLRGYDIAFDHRALTDDLSGRRFDRVAPAESLFLRKATGAVPHEGGKRIDASEADYAALASWIEGGVELDADAPRVARIELSPAKPTIDTPGVEQQFRVIAHYQDGSKRDVTKLAFFESSDREVTTIDEHGLATTVRRGDAAILARFEGRYAATRLFVMGDRSGFEWRDAPTHNYIDEEVYARLREIKTLPSEICTDAEFLRRASLDLIGRPPTPKEVTTFLADTREQRSKRDEAIDRLIGSAEFVEHWTNRWCDLLQVNSNFLGKRGARALRGWVRARIASNTPYDRFVRELLTANGSTIENPPAAYFKIVREPDLLMENTTQLFLGVRFNCNKCHDHPFERWTKDQHWELASFFSGVERKDVKGSGRIPRRGKVLAKGEKLPALEEMIADAAAREVEDPDGVMHGPAFPYEVSNVGAVEATSKDAPPPPRARLAEWMTDPANEYFARSYVNRIWSYFLGLGLIDPVDDIRASNPPTLPALLDRLTADFIEHGFDVRHVMRTICRSRVYQHSIESNEWNAQNRLHYARATARRLPAEVLFDAIHRATGSRTRLPKARAGVLATELVDASVEAEDGFLNLFGRPPRESACECERRSNTSLGQALNIVNGPTLADAIRDPDNDLVAMIESGMPRDEIVHELFLRFLCRPPTAHEVEDYSKSIDPREIANVHCLSAADADELAKRIAKLEQKMTPPTWHAVEVGKLKSSGGADINSLDDGSVLLSGAVPAKDRYTIVLHTDHENITGLRLEALPHESFPANGPGRAENGNFVLARITVDAVPLGDATKSKRVKLTRATAAFSQKGWPVAQSIVDSNKGWGVSPRFGRTHEAFFEAKENFGSKGGTLLIVSMDHPFGREHTLGRFRWSVTTSPRPIKHHGLPEEIAGILETAAEERGDEQLATLHRYFIGTDREMAERIRLAAVQDLAWALASSSAFLFNR